jgi:hypothetical protein
MAQQALQLMHQERWSEAQAMFAKAYELVPAPTIALLEGRALEQMGRLVQAADRYRLAAETVIDARTSPAFQEAARDAARDLARVKVKIPQLTIVIEGTVPARSQARVDVDGEEIEPSRLGSALAVNPGDHVITLTVDGNVRVREQLRLNESESKSVTLGLVPAVVATPPQADLPAEASPSRDNTAGWVTLGIGAAAITFGVATGLMMLDARKSLDGACKADCPQDQRDQLSRFRTTRVLSGIGYIAGGISLGIGAAILLWPSEPSENRSGARIRAFAQGEMVGVEGRC